MSEELLDDIAFEKLDPSRAKHEARIARDKVKGLEKQFSEFRKESIKVMDKAIQYKYVNEKLNTENARLKSIPGSYYD